MEAMPSSSSPQHRPECATPQFGGLGRLPVHHLEAGCFSPAVMPMIPRLAGIHLFEVNVFATPSAGGGDADGMD